MMMLICRINNLFYVTVVFCSFFFFKDTYQLTLVFLNLLLLPVQALSPKSATITLYYMRASGHVLAVLHLPLLNCIMITSIKRGNVSTLTLLACSSENIFTEMSCQEKHKIK